METIVFTCQNICYRIANVDSQQVKYRSQSLFDRNCTHYGGHF